MIHAAHETQIHTHTHQIEINSKVYKWIWFEPVELFSFVRPRRPTCERPPTAVHEVTSQNPEIILQ